VAIIAISLISNGQCQIATNEAIQFSLQAKIDRDQLISEAISLLQKNAKDNKDKALIDQLPATIELKASKDTMEAKALVIDAQGYFNINNLSNNVWGKSFTQLIQMVLPSLSDDSAKALSENIADFLKATDGLQKQSFFFPTQLWQQGLVSLAQFKLLFPAIIALPNQTPVNINSVKPIVLASLGDGMSLDDATELLNQHQQYQSVETFLKNHIVQKANINQDQLTVNSKYFLIKGLITSDKQNRMFEALLYRPSSSANTDGIVEVDLLWMQGG